MGPSRSTKQLPIDDSSVEFILESINLPDSKHCTLAVRDHVGYEKMLARKNGESDRSVCRALLLRDELAKLRKARRN